MGFLPPEREPEHPCKLPSIRPWFRHWLDEGTRWQCEACEQIWVVSGPNCPRHPPARWVRWRPMPTIRLKTAPAEMPKPPGR